MRQRYPQGFKGTDLPPVPKEQRRIWKAGGIADVSWVSVANHAGGYVCVSDTPTSFVVNSRRMLARITIIIAHVSILLGDAVVACISFAHPR